MAEASTLAETSTPAETRDTSSLAETSTLTEPPAVTEHPAGDMELLDSVLDAPLPPGRHGSPSTTDLTAMNGLGALVSGSGGAGGVIHVPPTEMAVRLAAMTPEERALELPHVPFRERNALARNPDFVTALRTELGNAKEFASVVAHLMVEIPGGLEQPVLARYMTIKTLERMLVNPVVAERLLRRGASVHIMPSTSGSPRYRSSRASPGTVDHTCCAAGRG